MNTRPTDLPRLVWTDSAMTLLDGWERQAQMMEDHGHESTAKTLRLHASELRAALMDGGKREWLEVADVAAALDLNEDSVRARCRRTWEAEGLARKIDSTWQIHRDAIAPDLSAAA